MTAAPSTNPYLPASRRPIAAIWRRTADAATRACVRARIHPDLISCASVLPAAGAAACFCAARSAPWLLVVAPLLCFARLWLNMLDGMVALAGGTASRRGELFNEVPDRASDVLIFAGLAHSGLAAPALGYWAALLAVLTAYVGTLGQAVGGRREYGGVMSKQWRMFALAPASWAVAAVLLLGLSVDPPALARAIMNGVLLVVIAGAAQTIYVRLAATLRRLDAAAAAAAGEEVRRDV